jgi:uridine kinase
VVQLRKILFDHVTRYPQMLPEDAVKLVYQNEFGCGHYVDNEVASLARLREEVQNLRPAVTNPTELFEDIGNGFSRLQLNALGDSLSLETVNRFFINTSRLEPGSEERFEKKLELLVALSLKGVLPFNPEVLGSYLQSYKKAGYPPVSHSQIYRELYAPSYRVVSSLYAHYFSLFLEIDRLLARQKSVVVAIDGPSGSGKSTLGEILQAVYDSPVVRMDHFFLRPEQRNPQRLEEPGGNVDYERFQKEVVASLRSNETFSYRIYDCKQNTLTWSEPIEAHRLRVVEGSYSLHPTLREDYDLRVFLTISPERQRERILKRNGPVMLERFVTEWIPLEELYFTHCQTKEQSDLVIGEYV